MEKQVRLARKKAQPISEVFSEYIAQMKLASGLNTRRIFEAWDQASGAAAYTTRRYFRDGTLYITLSSSVVCNALSFQKDLLIQQINRILEQDELFTRDDPRVKYVTALKLR